jgi:probable rRNA maturation factor
MGLRIQFHPLVEPPPELDPFPTETLVAMLREEGLADEGAVHCILAGDAELASLNRRFRSAPGPTDVLAFPYEPAQSDGVLGDIYVSLDRAAAQALERDEPLGREVWRLFVHGALHLAGYDHDTAAADRAMRVVQETWVARAWPRKTGE